MKICVLLPDYSSTSVDYQNYDPPRNLQPLLPSDEIHTVFLHKLTTYKQLKALQHKGFDCFINLCEGYLEWEIPSIDVIYTLELLNLPFTGPTSFLYDPAKELMKYVAYTEGIATPKYALIKLLDDLPTQIAHLQFPLFVKPAKAGDSLGIDQQSFVQNLLQLQNKLSILLDEFDEILVEEYIAGREFTVLIAANPNNEKIARTFEPVEFIFPTGNTFKTYALKTSELHPTANIIVENEIIKTQLQAAAQKIFSAFGGVGYARLDFRMDKNQTLYFLEINFTCSVFYSDGFEGSADYILKHDGIGQTGFLRLIIAEGIARHQRKQKKYIMKGNAIAGFGIYANKNIVAGEVVFKGEEQSQRMVTKRFVENNWNKTGQDLFKHYAYPISDEVYILWDNDPSKWAPQNHSCDANTIYDGLNVIAKNHIKIGDELTLDYGTFLNENIEPFNCKCGALNCRGLIQGMIGVSITNTEKWKRELDLIKIYK